MQDTIRVHVTQGDFGLSGTMTHDILLVLIHGEAHCTNMLQSFKMPSDCISYAPIERGKG